MFFLFKPHACPANRVTTTNIRVLWHGVFFYAYLSTAVCVVCGMYVCVCVCVSFVLYLSSCHVCCLVQAEFQEDLNTILRGILRLIQAVVDVLSTSSWLSSALAAMELSQMVVQATWASDSYLRQVPHMTPERLERAKAKDIQSVFDLTEMDDNERNDMLQMTPQELTDVVAFCNRYPSVGVEAVTVEDPENVHAGAPVTVTITMERDEDDDEDAVVGPIVAPFYPLRKDELWWLVVGMQASNGLLAIKKVPLQQTADVKLEFSAPEQQGKQTLKLYVMCDSYQGCDQEHEFELLVREPLEEESESEEDESEEEASGDNDDAMKED